MAFGPRVARRVLQYELERLREQAGVTHARAGERLGISRVGFTHLTSGRNLPSKPAVEVLMDLFGCPDRVPMMLELLSRAKQRTDGTGAPISSMNDFELAIGLEAVATDIEAFESMSVTGLLQTEAYARALIGYHASITPGVDVEQSVALRVQRQSVITRETAPARLWCVLEEQALRRPVANAEVMREQFEHLLDMTERQNVTLQVMPREVGLHPALKGPFFLLRFEDDWRVAYEETRHHAYYYDSADAVEDYAQVMNHLRHLALNPQRSRAFLERLRKEAQ
ncbi:transcriptional regulator with XRE-family HTH domain [Saccharothrix coeruleofusca]|uniref:helix-turn-helix domain-containing protein n=1 Tax=Saccharothrix coeruleofusca TaxID=33919 RepID=UPI001AE971D8|nr:helix-turn-helix transcriptional regulator [Saccharothrix coeruleofusca]MBP2339668.1 transcriptional regulator with XRE-family HTH domain [Saccharothrix coeruleofusca]